MKNFLKVGLFIVLLNLLVPAGTSAFVCPNVPRPLRPLAGFQALTVSTVAVSLTVPSGAILAIAQVEVADLRYRDDGTAPTATVGTLIRADSSIVICWQSIGDIQFIRDAGTDVTLSVNYYGN